MTEIEQARKRFSPVIIRFLGQDAIPVPRNSAYHIEGTAEIAIIFFQKFVDMFREPILKNNYTLRGFVSHSRKHNLGIDETVFRSWAARGCLVGPRSQS